MYIKSDIGYENIYKPRAKTDYISLDNIVRIIKNNDKISKDIKDDFIDAYNTIPNKTKIKFHNKFINNMLWNLLINIILKKSFS